MASFTSRGGSRAQGPGFNFAALSDFSNISAKGQDHLKNVYTSLSMTMLAAATGAYVNMFTASFLGSSGMVAFLGTLGCLMALGSSRGQATTARLGMLLGFGFFSGVSAGPLISQVARIDPAIPLTAFLYSCIVFGCFSMAALKAPSRSYLFLGGILSSALMVMLTMSIVNLFFASAMMFQAQIYGGLLVFSGFIVYDTQLIIEKQRLGDNDYLWHAVDLFIDFMAVFKRIMVILAQNNDKKKKSNSRRR